MKSAELSSLEELGQYVGVLTLRIQVLYRYFALAHSRSVNQKYRMSICLVFSAADPPLATIAMQDWLSWYTVTAPVSVPVYLTHAWGPRPHQYALNIQGQEMRYQTGAVTVYQDNQTCMAIVAARGRSAAEKMRHIDIRYFCVKERAEFSVDEW